MQNDYTGYSVEQLLNDDYFISWLLTPNAENDRFWNQLRDKDSILAGNIDTARSLIMHLRCDLKVPDFSKEEKEQMWQSIQRRNKAMKRKHLYRQFSVSVGIAAIFCLCFWGIWEEHQKKQPEIDYMAIMKSIDTIPLNKIELILSEKQKIAIEGKNGHVEYAEDGKIHVNSQKVAEAASAGQSIPLNQLIVPYGRRSSITFSDGTQVWVNSGSKVIYPATFDKDKREIFVEGEIFLDVAHNEECPFVVKTKQMEVEVLGTRFDVSAYKEDSQMQVTLVEGKVKVIAANNSHSSILLPNQQFNYDVQSDKACVKSVDVDSYVSWKNGYYQFKEQPLSIVFQKLSRYYDIQIVWDEAVGKLICSGKLDFKDDFNDVLNNLKNVAPIQVAYDREFVKINMTP